ncbi:MAG TPA: hypothetical protein VKA03_04310 [Methylovirgula sp.]|nr:hypothetical protein [Methylovirgula sp.]
MTLASSRRERFYTALRAAGMPETPGEFSVAPGHQIVSGAVLAEIAGFIRVFDRVTGGEAWQAAARREAPGIAQPRRCVVCFFSAWDFHCPPEGGFELIEFNDNGSGFLYAAIINALFYEAAELEREKGIAPPATISEFIQTIGDLVEREAIAFFGERPTGLLLILDDFESLRDGKFRGELRSLRDLLRKRGWQAELGYPADTRWDGRRLTFEERPVSFIINRSTDFLWRSDDFAALREAYQSGSVYAAPNPFTYVTRSNKRLLEWLSLPQWDGNHGIDAEERRILSAHVPVTHVLRADNVDMLAQGKRDFVFKPMHGFAGRGLLDSAAVGRVRLRRLLRAGEGYVAQKRVAKPWMEVDGTRLWTDLRVWAYRGEIFLVSGRASKRPDRLALAPPGGWLPTFASL